MPLSAAQEKLYWGIWKRLSKALEAYDPTFTKAEIRDQRVGQHRTAKCPDSHKEWKSLHLSRFIAHADVVADPDNLDLRLRFDELCHEHADKIHLIRHYLGQLGRPVSYAAACAHNPELPQDLCKWPAEALQAALMALNRTRKSPKTAG